MMAKANQIRVGFVGTGWIGCHRLRALVESDLVEVVAVHDPAPEAAAEALRVAPFARSMRFEELLRQGLDGVVIATPSALHAEQAMAALETGSAVFCQKPLARTAPETDRVVQAARRADRLLGLDLSYRTTAAMSAIRQLVRAGELGHVYGMSLVFHNAYGPDKPWFKDPARSGGGCVIDLGIHLVDLALWLLDFPDVQVDASALLRGGRPVAPSEVEDYAQVQLRLPGGVPVSLACSWWLPAGRDAVISVEVYGTDGGAAMRNVGGSFFDFGAERYHGTAREVLAEPPDEWGGRAIVEWARRVARGDRFDAEAERYTTVARVLDRIYGR